MALSAEGGMQEALNDCHLQETQEKKGLLLLFAVVGASMAL